MVTVTGRMVEEFVKLLSNPIFARDGFTSLMLGDYVNAYQHCRLAAAVCVYLRWLPPIVCGCRRATTVHCAGCAGGWACEECPIQTCHYPRMLSLDEYFPTEAAHRGFRADIRREAKAVGLKADLPPKKVLIKMLEDAIERNS